MRIRELFRRKAVEIVKNQKLVPVMKRLDITPSLPDIIQWTQGLDVQKKPWLVLGKGPSYSRIKDVDLHQYYTCSLNHVVREQPVDLAHIIDIDVVEDCKDILDKNARFLVLPYYPHVHHNPANSSIEDFVRKMPVLKAFAEQRRLFWYNLSSSRTQVGTSPVIVANFFSAEAAVNILATCGVKIIRSLGIDGGNAYASTYTDLKYRTLLANGHPSFDRQFEQIAKTIRTHRIFYAPLHKEAPIKVFVGTDRSQMLGVKVLEYSIKKYASMSVDVVPMCEFPVPVPKDPQNRPRTGFSFSRFLMPSLCDYKGRAIYLDADMLVFNDIVKLWDMEMGRADILCAEQPTDKGRIRQYSVLLMNCSNLLWNIEEIVAGLDVGRYDYRGLMYEFGIVPPEKIAPTLPYEWNSLEYYKSGKTCLIHYTDMPTQPWISYKNKYGRVWYDCLKDAISEGFISLKDVYQEVEQGHILPDLPQYLGFAPHPDFKRIRKNFVPPYTRFKSR